MYRIGVEDSGLIVVVTSGFWSVALADAYRIELAQYLAAARAKRGYALSLIDGRENAVQSPEVMARFADFENLTAPGERDRSALVVPSSLAKLQAHRITKSPRSKAFLSLNAARMWLLAYENTGLGGMQEDGA